MMKYPIIAITGDFGAGKTLYMTFLGRVYHDQEGMHIFANYKQKAVDYTPIQFRELRTFPDDVHDGVLLMDEGQVDADAYNFWKKGVQDMTHFITQLRKRNLILLYTAPRFSKVVKSLRDYTNYEVRVYSKEEGVVTALTYKREEGFPPVLINDKTYILRAIYPLYDTKQIIMPGDDT